MQFQENSPKCLPRQEFQVVFCESSATRGFELHVESVGHLHPGDLLRDQEWLSTPLSESIVPEDGGPGVGLLVPVHDHNHGEGGGAHLHAVL